MVACTVVVVVTRSCPISNHNALIRSKKDASSMLRSWGRSTVLKSHVSQCTGRTVGSPRVARMVEA